MIIEEQIEKAAFEETFGMYGESESLEKGFICDAKQAINEFLNNLWHSNDEEPRKGTLCLIQMKLINGHSLPEYTTTTYIGERKWTNLYIADDTDMKIIRWLYIDDLLPKEGSESIQTIHLIKNIQDYNMNR